MKYYNLLILFMIALKCGADEESTTVNDSTDENVTNSEIFSASSTEGKLANIRSSSETNGSENTVINATDNDVVEVKKKEFDLPTPTKLAQQGNRMVKNIIGSLMKRLTVEEPSTVNYSLVDFRTKNTVSNASTTEAPENLFDKWTQLPNINISTLINATDAYAINPFKNKEFGKLPIPRKLPRHRTRLVTKITGSLMNGLAQLNKTDSEEDSEDDEEPTTVNYSTVENVNNSEVANASTIEAPENLFDKLTQLPHISKSTLTSAKDAYAINPFKNKEFGKLPIPRMLPRYRTRLVTNITGSLMKALAQLHKQDSEEDSEDNEEPTTVNYSTIENVTNIEISNARTTDAPENLFDKWTQLLNIIISSLINATDAYAINPFMNKEFGKLPIPRKLPRHRTQLVTNITGNLMKALAPLNKQDWEEDSEDDEEPTTTVNYPTVENVRNSEISNASTTEALENLFNKWILLPNINSSSETLGAESTRINLTATTVSPFKKKEFGKLPIPRRTQRGSWLMKKITGSLMDGLAQLNETDSEDDEEIEEPTTANYATVENVSNSEVSNANSTEAPDYRFEEWIQLSNISSSRGSPATEKSLIKVTDGNVVGPSTKTEFGKLLKLGTLPLQGTRIVTNIVGSLLKGLARDTDSNEDEDGNIKKI